jgi:aspartyl protease family protein
MPEFKLDPEQSIIICHAEIVGPRAELSLKMVLDTGATYTMIPIEAALSVGCNPLRSRRKIEITTGSGIEYVPLITVSKFKALGVEIKNMEVVCHNLPTQSPVEGLLGLNFLKKSKAIIDFSKNAIRL